MIKIIRQEDVVDNWGKREVIEAGDVIYQTLKDPRCWTDDLSFGGENSQIYFIDDLIGKEVLIEGYQPFKVEDNQD